jgi:hypothetical protein
MSTAGLAKRGKKMEIDCPIILPVAKNKKAR